MVFGSYWVAFKGCWVVLGVVWCFWRLLGGVGGCMVFLGVFWMVGGFWRLLDSGL